MAQLFSPAADVGVRVVLVLFMLSVIGMGGAGYAWVRSSYVTRAGLVRPQPVAFSHEHHVNGLGLDCRYCHTSVERSPFAGIPATSICMNCHSQIWVDSPMLEPVRASWESGEPLRWTRVHDLPDFTYFDHSVHVKRGVGCATCHGRVDQMALTYKSEAMTMRWCLDCHREPGRRIADQVGLVERSAVYASLMNGAGSPSESTPVRRTGMSDCHTCHR